jgi:polar amino acid transport system substrate-binding protein
MRRSLRDLCAADSIDGAETRLESSRRTVGFRATGSTAPRPRARRRRPTFAGPAISAMVDKRHHQGIRHVADAQAGGESMHRKALANRLIGIILVLLGLFSAGAMAETIRITNGEWPPFTSERLAHKGPLSRIVTEAFALEGITVEYGHFPWKRAYDYAKTGKWDGSVGWAPTPKHLHDFHMSTPVITVDKGLFHLKNIPFDWKSIDDLRGWRVGGTAGYAYGDEWDRAVREGKFKVDEVTTDEQNIRKLLLRRVDVVAMEVDVANHLIRTLLTPEEAATIMQHPKLVMQTPICLALSRQSARSPELLKRFNRGLQRLTENGAYERHIQELHTGAKP